MTFTFLGCLQIHNHSQFKIQSFISFCGYVLSETPMSSSVVLSSDTSHQLTLYHDFSGLKQAALQLKIYFQGFIIRKYAINLRDHPFILKTFETEKDFLDIFKNPDNYSLDLNMGSVSIHNTQQPLVIQLSQSPYCIKELISEFVSIKKEVKKITRQPSLNPPPILPGDNQMSQKKASIKARIIKINSALDMFATFIVAFRLLSIFIGISTLPDLLVLVSFIYSCGNLIISSLIMINRIRNQTESKETKKIVIISGTLTALISLLGMTIIIFPIRNNHNHTFFDFYQISMAVCMIFPTILVLVKCLLQMLTLVKNLIGWAIKIIKWSIQKKKISETSKQYSLKINSQEEKKFI